MRSGEVEEVSCVTAPRNYPPSPRFATIAAHATATLTTATSSSSKGEAGIDSVDVTAALRDPLSQDAGPRTHFHYYSSGAVDHDGMPLLMAVRGSAARVGTGVPCGPTSCCSVHVGLVSIQDTL